jgi:hypothetical protein
MVYSVCLVYFVYLVYLVCLVHIVHLVYLVYLELRVTGCALQVSSYLMLPACC